MKHHLICVTIEVLITLVGYIDDQHYATWRPPYIVMFSTWLMVCTYNSSSTCFWPYLFDSSTFIKIMWLSHDAIYLYSISII